MGAAVCQGPPGGDGIETRHKFSATRSPAEQLHDIFGDVAETMKGLRRKPRGEPGGADVAPAEPAKRVLAGLELGPAAEAAVLPSMGVPAGLSVPSLPAAGPLASAGDVSPVAGPAPPAALAAAAAAYIHPVSEEAEEAITERVRAQKERDDMEDYLEAECSVDMATCLAMTQSLNEEYRQKIATRNVSHMREHLKVLVAEADYTAARCHDGPRTTLPWDSALTNSQAMSAAKIAAAAAERYTDKTDAILAQERARAREHPGIVVNSDVSRQQSELFTAAAERTREARKKRKRADDGAPAPVPLPVRSAELDLYIVNEEAPAPTGPRRPIEWPPADTVDAVAEALQRPHREGGAWEAADGGGAAVVRAASTNSAGAGAGAGAESA